MKNYNEKLTNSIVVPVWSDPVNLKTENNENIEQNICDTKELFEALKREGYRIRYKRIPLSKEREIMAEDFDEMEGLPLQPDIPNLIISRTVDGTSARYVSTFICCYQDYWYSNQQKLKNNSPFCSNQNNQVNNGTTSTTTQTSTITKEISDEIQKEPFFNINSSNLKNCNINSFVITNIKSRPNKTIIQQQGSSNSDDIYSIGDYSGILNLCRLEKNGLQCKALVDKAINACLKMGNLLEDILSCKNLYDKDEEGKNKAHALGLIYLKRYFMLVAFRCYLEDKINHKCSRFSEWFKGRKEILYLFKTLDLNR